MNGQKPFNATVSASVQSGADRVLFVNATVAALTVAMFVSYLAVGANSVQQGFELREAEKRVVSLEERQEKLGFQVLSRRSMDNLEEQINELGYVPVGQVDYLQVNGAVAVR